MARRGRGTMEEVPVSTDNATDFTTEEDGGPTFDEFTPAEDVDVERLPDDGADETDEVVDEEKPAKAKAAKKTAAKSRGELPEGYVTPVGLAHELTRRGLGGVDEDGDNKVVPPQMVYSYMKNASKTDPFPIETVEDSVGSKRQALKLDAGLAWWERKNKRAAERKANAADKQKKAAKKAEASATEVVEDEAPAEEAE